MFKKLIPIVMLLGVVGARPAAAQKLKMGDPAPRLEVKQFLKGAPVKALEKGKMYVVEFWATWCGPCRQTIPHLSELQKKFPAVTFIGVSIWEESQAGVAPFVKQMGNKMEYRVAMDAVAPNDRGGRSGKMATNWMQAAGQNGIPSAFIINKEGKVAWIGHPGAMEEPLSQIVAGKYNLQRAAAQKQQESRKQARMMELAKKVQAAEQAKNPKAALAAVNQAFKEDPALERMLGTYKLNLLTRTDMAQATAYGNRLVDGPYKSNPEALNQIAWTLVAPEAPKPSKQMAALSLKAALKADTLSKGKNPAVADTLARAYFVNGNAAKAYETQQRAIALAKGTPLEKRPDLPQRLAEYKKAAGR